MKNKEELTATEQKFLETSFNFLQRMGLPDKSIVKGADIGLKLDLRRFQVEEIVSSLKKKMYIDALENTEDPDFRFNKISISYFKK